MKNYKAEKKTIGVLNLESIICDICKKEYTDTFEIQEFTSISKDCGYASVFGDGDNIECDICQHCLKKFIDGKYRILYM